VGRAVFRALFDVSDGTASEGVLDRFLCGDARRLAAVAPIGHLTLQTIDRSQVQEQEFHPLGDGSVDSRRKICDSLRLAA
jgi:hypothetical protein